MSYQGRVCRVCMRSGGDMSTLYDEGGGRWEKIVFCTGLQICESDGLPSHICAPCTVLLDSAYQFKMTCLTTDEELRRNAVKLEHDCNVEDVKIEEDVRDVDRTSFEGSDYEAGENINITEVKIEQVNETEIDDGTRRKRRRPLWCEICSIEFPSAEAARRHAKETHKEELKLICEFCGKVSEKRATHYYHIRSHLPPNFKCDLCPYATWHKYDLRKHVSIHTGVKKYQCEFCTAAYHTVSNLRCHIRRTHEGRRDFPCHMCSLKFFDKRRLNEHLDRHNDIKRYMCEECGVSLSRRNYLSRHMLRQHGVRIETPRPGRQKTNIVVADALAGSILCARAYTKRNMKATGDNTKASRKDGDGVT